jgi:hypothetical protein
MRLLASFIKAATGDRVPCVYIENHWMSESAVDG